MPKRTMPPNAATESFGKKLAGLRRTAGFSQREFAGEAGISQRMVAYYEKETSHAPAHLLPTFAKVLGVSLDQLLGLEKSKGNGKTKDSRLWRRFSQVERLPPPQKKQIVQILDTFLEREKLRKAI